MANTAVALLSPWATFYVVIGSSAGALTGLMFVVITIVTGAERTARSEDGVATFSTPTVMHFCAALFVAAVLIAPWHKLIYPGALVGVFGLFEIVYLFLVAMRTRRIVGYTPDLDDWMWYSILPLAGYATIALGAAGLAFAPAAALFAVAAGVLILVFIGIRNAWDVVTYLTVGGGAPSPK